MNNDTAENDYLDMLDEIEVTEPMQRLLDDVSQMIDDGMVKLRPAERVVVGMQIATLIGTNSLANALNNHRHLLNPAVEKLAEDITEYAKAMFEAFDNGKLTTH